MNEIIVKDWKVLNSPESLTGIWLTGEELGKHLGYSEPRRTIGNIFKRHEQVFRF